jgi:phosphatidylinositol-3-phosphatase
MSRQRPAVIGLILVGLLAGWIAAPAGAQPRPAGLEGVPSYKHVVVLVEENESQSVTFAPDSPAHYLNELRNQGTYTPNYYGTGHVSLGNYIAMTSGQPGNPLTDTDCVGVSLYTCAQTTLAFDNGRHLGDQLDDAGVSWKAYMDGAPTPCFHSPYATDPYNLVFPDLYQGDGDGAPDGAQDYADRHNPFIYYPDLVGNDARCAAHERPFSELAGDLAADQLPAFSFITPDTCHDGHDDPCSSGAPGGLVSADAWLAENGPPLIDYLNAHDGLLVITFDEGGRDPDPAANSCATCAAYGIGGRVGAVIVGTHVPAGRTVPTGYDHMSLLRTLEDSFGIAEHLNLAANALPMTDVFVSSKGRR